MNQLPHLDAILKARDRGPRVDELDHELGSNLLGLFNMYIVYWVQIFTFQDG